jgi:hypothetical protein
MQGINTMIKLNTYGIKKNLTVGPEVITAVVMKSSIFWDIKLHNLLKVNNPFQKNKPPLSSGSRNKPGNAICFMLVSCLAFSLTLKMEATSSVKTLGDFEWTICCYITEDRTLQNLIMHTFWHKMSYLTSFAYIKPQHAQKHFHAMVPKHFDMMPLSIFTKPSCLPNFCY